MKKVRVKNNASRPGTSVLVLLWCEDSLPRCEGRLIFCVRADLCTYLFPQNKSLTGLMFFVLIRYKTAGNPACLEQLLRVTWEVGFWASLQFGSNTALFHPYRRQVTDYVSGHPPACGWWRHSALASARLTALQSPSGVPPALETGCSESKQNTFALNPVRHLHKSGVRDFPPWRSSD